MVLFVSFYDIALRLLVANDLALPLMHTETAILQEGEEEKNTLKDVKIMEKITR